MPPPPTSPHNTSPTDHRAWSTASVLSGHAGGRRLSDRDRQQVSQPHTQPHTQSQLQPQSQSDSRSQSGAQSQSMSASASRSNAHFHRRLSSKKELKGGMTYRWLKEDPRRDTRKDYVRALAVLEPERERGR